MFLRRVLALVALVGIVGLAGCVTGPTPEIVEQQCGNIAGVGGCQVTVANPGDEAMEVRVTVQAMTEGDEVAGENSETVTIPGGEQREVTVGVANLGGDVDRYEASVERV
jgi:hypothetical protein